MAQAITFDDLEFASNENKPDKPLWMLDVDHPGKEKEVLAWLNGEVSNLQAANRSRFTKIRKNLMLYKGIQYYTQEVRDADQERQKKKYKLIQKIVINHLFDLVQQRISRLIEYKPSVTWHPTSDEYGDKISAQLMEMFNDHIWYINQFEDDIVPDLVTWSKLMGEAYLFQLWNPSMGPVHPDWVKAKKTGKQIPLLDEHDAPLLDADGNPRFITDEVHVGDVEFDPEVPFNVFPQRKPLWKEVDYVFRVKWWHIEEAKLRWRDADPAKFKASAAGKVYDYELMEQRDLRNEVMIAEMFYRECRGMDKGRYIAFSPDGIIENLDYFEKTGLHKELPCERLVDIKLPMEPHGTSFIDHIKGPTAAYNNITNLILRNQYLVSHPKWMMPAGSASLEELGNDVTIVQFRGPIAPQLVQASPTPPELFNFRKELKGDFEQVGGVYSVSRGNPPPGIDAGIALQFLEEQESKRANPDYLIFNSFIKRVALKTQKIAGSKYEESDERTVGILGKYDQWMSTRLKLTDFQKDYDVRVANSSALPKSKTARIQTLVYLQKNYPDAIPQEQVIDMMELGQSSRFTDAVTVAVRAAELENDDMMSSREVAEPQEWENHIQHWRIHARVPQEYFFKKLPDNVKEAFQDHIMATEMLMWDKAQINPAFAAVLQTLPNYPMFFMPDVPASTTNPVVPPADGEAPTASEPIAGDPGLPGNPGASDAVEEQEIVRPTRLVGQNAPPLAGMPSAGIEA